MTQLVASSVSFRYSGTIEALRDVSFETTPGEILALVGPNGSGKSTLLRVAAGIAPSHDGRIELAGNDLRDLDRRERARRIAFLPQRVVSTYAYSVHDVVRLGRHPHRSGWGGLNAEDEAVVLDALESTGVAALRDRPLDALSGGERQRVLLAAALAQGGEVLLLDEPTAALDLHHQLRFMKVLREVVASGRTVVWATHDLNLAAAYADRVLLLAEGRKVAMGTAAEVFTAPQVHAIYGDDLWVGSHPGGPGVAVLPPPGSDSR